MLTQDLKKKIYTLLSVIIFCRVKNCACTCMVIVWDFLYHKGHKTHPSLQLPEHWVNVISLDFCSERYPSVSSLTLFGFDVLIACPRRQNCWHCRCSFPLFKHYFAESFEILLQKTLISTFVCTNIRQLKRLWHGLITGFYWLRVIDHLVSCD